MSLHLQDFTFTDSNQEGNIKNYSLSTKNQSISLSAEEGRNPFERSESQTNKIDWMNVQSSVMDWFAQKEIITGNPLQLIDLFEEKQRLNITRKMSKAEGSVNESQLSKRLGRKLTISF